MIFLFTVPLWLGVIIWIIYALVAQSNRKRTLSQLAAVARAAQIEQHRQEWEAERNSKKCPMCAELVKAEAQIYRFCGHMLGKGLPAPPLRSRTYRPGLLPRPGPRPIGEWKLPPPATAGKDETPGKPS